MNPTRALPIMLFAAALLLPLQFAASQQLNPDPEGCCQCLDIEANQSMLGGESPSTPASPITNSQGELEVTISVTLSSDEDCSDITIDSVIIRPVGQLDISIGINGENKAFVDPALVRTYGNQWEVVVKCTRTKPKKSESTCIKSFSLSTGCSSCDTECANAASISVDGHEGLAVSIPTTSSTGGMATGTLRYLNQGSDYIGRSGIFASVPSEFDVTRDPSGNITQVDTGEVLIDIEDVAGEDAFTITHTIQGQPSLFRSVKIATVNDNGIDLHRVDTTFDGVTRRWEQSHPQPNIRILDQGPIINGTFEALTRQEFSESTPSAGVLVKRAKTYERASSSTPWSAASMVSDAETTWEKQIRGWIQTKEIINPDGSALTSTWEYYQPGELTGPNAATEGLGRLKHHVRYDGYESFHTYSLNQSTVTTPYAGNAAGKITTTTWNPGSQTRIVETSANGQVVSKTITAHTATSQTQTQHTSGSETLTTVTHFKPSGQDFGGRPVRTLHADGTLTTYDYVRDAQTSGYTTTVDNGLPNAGNTVVTQGIRTITTVNSRGATIHRKTEAIGYGTGTAVFEEMAVTEVDFVGRTIVTAYFPASVIIDGDIAIAPNPAWTTEVEYSCCGIAREVDRHGIETFHAYDHLQRRIKSNRLGVTTETQYLGLTTESHRYPETVSASLSPALNGTAATLVSRSVRNLTGTLQESWSPDPTSATAGALIKSSSTTTTYAPEPGLSRRTVTTTADNFSQTTDSFLDGRTAATYGDLSPAMAYSYSVNSTGEFTAQAYVVGTEHREVTGSQSDWAGRTVKSGHLSSLLSTVFESSVSMHYNSKGQLVRTVDPDGVTTLMVYNAKGERTTTATDLEPSATYNDEQDNIDYGTDTVQFSVTEPALSGGNPVWVTTSKVWQPGQTDPNGGTVVSTSLRSADGLSSSNASIGVANPSTTVTALQGNGNWTTTQTNPDDTFGITTYVDGRMVSSAMFAAGADPEEDAPIVATGQTYDHLNRPVSTTDSRTGTTVTAYMSDTNDAVASVTDPGNRTTAFTYDIRGRQISVTLPDNTETTTTYTPRGEVAGRSGSQTYPVTYTYDYAGRQATMTTYGTEEATTTWEYSTDRGHLLRKEYDDGNGTNYTYTAAGRLLTRTWERDIVTLYTYDLGGRLTDTEYWGGDSLYQSYLTAVASYQTVLADSQSTQQQIDDAQQAVQDAASAGAVANTPNVSIAYDALGRQLTQSNGVAQSTYTYNPNNLQIDTEEITYTLPGADPFTRIIDRSQDTLGRDSGWELKDNSTIENSASYTYGATDGRLASLSGGPAHAGQPPSQFNYTYTANSNLIASVTGPAHTVTNTWDPTRNVLDKKENKVGTTEISTYDYSVNGIGQRTSVATSGTAFSGASSWSWGYDSLGQVTLAEHGTNSNFHRSYAYDAIGNRQRAAEGTLDVNATSATVYTPNALNQYSSINDPQSTILNPTHDADGNMTSGPLPVDPASASTLTWDAENRLIAASVNSTTVTYTYDAQSRRIATKVGSNTTLFVYDGWNPIAEYEGSAGVPPALAKGYTWGIDLSGSSQGAGGVGGLLAVAIHDQQSSIYYPTYDGNGNVSEYLDATGAIVAHYEYDPFGRIVVESGTKSADFAHRFSTKPQDLTTGLLYYGYRWYDPVTGRWPSRDPMQERGGINLYGFVGNDGVRWIDYLGYSNWVTYKSNYGDVTTGNSNTSYQIWKYIDDKNILSNVKDDRHEPINGKNHIIHGMVDQRGKVSSGIVYLPKDENGLSRCCVTIDIEHIVDSVTMYLGSFELLRKSYKGIAAHETNHIQAGFERIYEVYTEYITTPRPCFDSAIAAIKEGDRLRDEIKNKIGSSGVLVGDFGVASPGGVG